MENEQAALEVEANAKQLTKAERKAQRRAEHEARQAQAGTSVGGAILDNGPANPSVTETETPGGSQTAKVVETKPSDQVKTDWFNKGKEDGKTVQDAEAGAFK